MILQMSKVEIIGPRRNFYDVLSSLHNLGVLHIEDISKKVEPGELVMRRMEVDEEVESRRRELQTLLNRVESLLAALRPEEKEKIPEAEIDRHYQAFWSASCEELQKEVEKVLEGVEKTTRELAEKKTQLEEERANLAKYAVVLKKIKPLASQLVALEGFETVALLVERKYKGVLDLVREEMNKLTKGQFELVSADVDEETTAALLVFNKTYSEPVNSFLWAEKVNRVKLPEEYAEKPFDEAYETIISRLKSIPAEVDKVKEELKEISANWYARLLAIRNVLTDRCGELEVAYFAGQTDYTFVIEGWVPRRELDKMKEALTEEFGGKVLVSEVEVTEEEKEEAPVILDNPFWAKPYELVMGIFGYPRYGTLDPTVFLAIFYPIFFGLVLGDIGYGLSLLAIGLLLRYSLGRVPIVKMLSTMVIMAAVMVMFFGFIYGEFFGNIPHVYEVIRPFRIDKEPTPEGERIVARILPPHHKVKLSAEEENLLEKARSIFESRKGEVSAEEMATQLKATPEQGEKLLEFLQEEENKKLSEEVLALLSSEEKALSTEEIAEKLKVAPAKTEEILEILKEEHEVVPIGGKWREVKVLFELPFDRGNIADYLLPYMFLAVGLGFGHILLGFVLGMINALREHAKRHAIENLGMIILLVSIIFLVLVVQRAIPQFFGSLTVFLILIAFVLIVYGGGVTALFHIPSVISNIASYLRLMALGLAGVILAVIGNQLGSMFDVAAIGVLVALLVHFLNIVVHSFSATIHSMRLNIVEFFNKFVVYGGKPYKPFKKAGR